MNHLNRYISFIFLLFAVASICSCSGVKPITAAPPVSEAFRTVLKNETSIINIPIEATSADLAKLLNVMVRKDLYKGSTKTRGVSAEVVRNGNIVLTASDNYLFLTLPISMSLSYGMFELKPIPLKLKFKVTAGVTSDWRLHTEIYYQGLSDLLAEDVGIGPIKIKPRSIVESLTQPLQKIVSDLISQKINELIPVKSQVAKVWSSSQKPVLLDKKYSAWLKLTPAEIMMFPLYTQNDRVKMSVGISTIAEMVVGPEPAIMPLRPLPNLKLVKTFDKTFRIALNTNLYYSDLKNIAEPLLLNKKFDSDGKSITVKAFDLFGNGDKIVVKLQTEGALDGVFYLTAKPVFDSKTNIFSVQDVDFDMQTKDILLSSADWFLHGTIKGIIQEKLNMNLTKQLETSRQMAAKSLAEIQLKDNIFLRCDIKNLRFNDVIVQKDKILIQVYSEGESAVFIK